MKFSALAIATLTTLAAAHLGPESQQNKDNVNYHPIGPHHDNGGKYPENKHSSPGNSGKGGFHGPGVTNGQGHHHPHPNPHSPDGDNIKVIKIAPDHPGHHNPPPVPPKPESPPPPIPPKHDSRPPGKDKPHCPSQKHDHKHNHNHNNHGHNDNKQDHKPNHQHNHEEPPEHRPHGPPHPPHNGHQKPHHHPQEGGECTPGTYACTSNHRSGIPGWKTCNANGKFEYAGDCPPKTVCKFYQPSKSPYCVPRCYEFP